MDITITIEKRAVMDEVAQTTSYTGAKMSEDAGAYERISTVDEDEKQLERFWAECRADISQELIGIVSYEGMIGSGDDERYELRLDVSRSFDMALLPSMQISLFNFFVMGITAKWYIYTNKKEAGEYADKATGLLDDVHRKAVYKKRPTRPVYDD